MKNKAKFSRNNYISSTTNDLLKSFVFTSEDKAEKVLNNYPKKTKIIELTKILIEILFPGAINTAPKNQDDLRRELNKKLLFANKILRTELSKVITLDNNQDKNTKKDVERISSNFFNNLIAVRTKLILDLKAAYQGDPAAKSYGEILISYPGMLAITIHRIAHELYLNGVQIIPRIMSEWAHTETGADIHPGAKIGDGFFIDHCTGVVIGETAVIGENVKIYQGATLGAKSFPVDQNGHAIKNLKRHPTVENNVVIYANATILGGETVIGSNSTIGAGVFIMQSVPANTLVVNKPADLKTESKLR